MTVLLLLLIARCPLLPPQQEHVARRNAWVKYHIKLGDYDRAIELGWDKDTGVVGDDITADPELEMPKAA